MREGEFSETKGAPALRLLGDVRPAAHTDSSAANIIRKNVTDDAVLRNFLDQTPVRYPRLSPTFMSYVTALASDILLRENGRAYR